MKVYITTRFKESDNKSDIEALCKAVADSGMEDFSFVRDVENYQKTLFDPKELWKRALLELQKCDALLIDVTDAPTGGRVIEAGFAYALSLPIFVIVKEGTNYKDIFNGIATKVIEFKEYEDITVPLASFLAEQQFLAQQEKIRVAKYVD